MENSSSQTKIVGSVGGGVIINKDEFFKIGGENSEIRGWGTDDIDRVFTVLTNGKKVFRAKGDIYHFDHERVSIDEDLYKKNVVEQIIKYIE